MILMDSSPSGLLSPGPRRGFSCRSATLGAGSRRLPRARALGSTAHPGGGFCSRQHNSASPTTPGEYEGVVGKLLSGEVPCIHHELERFNPPQGDTPAAVR